MSYNEILNTFVKLGYIVQEPKNNDKTYFFVKHINKGSKMIYLKLKKTYLEVEVLLNFKPGELTKSEDNLIANLAGNLGYDTYKVI